MTDNFPEVGYTLVPEILIADPRIFCGSPGERITYGDLIKNAADIKSTRANLLDRANLDFMGRMDRIKRFSSYA